MTYSYFEAYAYKRFKNADVIFTKSVPLEEENMMPHYDFDRLESHINVKPSILRPEIGSKVIDAMRSEEKSIYFKADVNFPDDSERQKFGSIDWSTVNFERDDRHGLSVDCEQLLDANSESAYVDSKVLFQNDKTGFDQVIKTGIAEESPVFSAIESGQVEDITESVNNAFNSRDSSAKAKIVDLIKVNDDWYATTSREELQVGLDENSNLGIAKVSEFNSNLQNKIEPYLIQAESKLGNEAELANFMIKSGDVKPQLVNNVPISGYASEFRLMFSDALQPDDTPANIKDKIFKNAKATTVAKSETNQNLKQLDADEIEF